MKYQLEQYNTVIIIQTISEKKFGPPNFQGPPGAHWTPRNLQYSSNSWTLVVFRVSKLLSRNDNSSQGSHRRLMPQYTIRARDTFLSRGHFATQLSMLVKDSFHWQACAAYVICDFAATNCNLTYHTNQRYIPIPFTMITLTTMQGNTQHNA